MSDLSPGNTTENTTLKDKVILCVEDNKTIQKFNKIQFEEHGFIVKAAFSLAEAKKILDVETPDLIILDVYLTDGNGLDFLRGIRAPDSPYVKIPVLVLTSLGKDADIVAGFENGCNDYLVKPYAFPVLLMRAKELLNRLDQDGETTKKGSLILDKLSSRAYLAGHDLLLKPKEFALLFLLSQNEGAVLSMDFLYEKIWKAPVGGSKGTLHKHMSEIRKKLEEAHCEYTIKAVYGEGYCFEKTSGNH